MAQMREVPLDEIVWSSPDWARHLGGVHTDSILNYFAESAFFDRQSNNQALLTQARSNPDMAMRIHSRAEFEAQLRGMQGLEFVVAAESQQVLGGDSGVWIIRKQMRKKQSEGMPDDITVLGTYFVVGENIYQAPSIGDIIECRLVTLQNCMTKFLGTASKLSTFTPARGHSYFSNSSKPDKTGAVSRATSRPASRSGTPLPDSVPTSQGRSAAAPTPGAAVTDLYRIQRELFHSLTFSEIYGAEYMDENPLTGEPGSFVFSQTNERVSKQKQDELARLAEEEAAKAEAAAKKLTLNTSFGRKASMGKGDKPRSPTSPLSASGPGRMRRKRNRTNPGSPMSPKTPKTPGAGLPAA